MNIKFFVILTVAFFFVNLTFVNLASADDSLSTKVHNQYTSFRAMGMGNAYTAVADDYSLMFYNPAGFAKKRFNEVQFSVVGVGVSPKTLTLMEDIKKASETGTESQKASAVSGVLDQYYGKSLGGSVQAAEIFWTRKHWGIAILPAHLTIDMSFNRQLGPAIDLNVIGDTTIAYGYGNDVNKYLAAGITAKYIHRVSVDRSVSALELASDSNILSTKRFKEGTSIDFDIGMLWTPNWFNKNEIKVEAVSEVKAEIKPEVKPAPELNIDEDLKPDAVTPATPPSDGKEEKRMVQSENILVNPSGDATIVDSNTKPEPGLKKEPPVKGKKKVKTEKVEVAATPVEKFPLTFSLVLRNILGGSFTQSTMVNKDATEVPNKMNFVIDAGTQYELAKFGELTFRTMVDFKNMLHPDITLSKSFHAGIEADYYPNSWFKTQLRAGMNQMYYTAGATFLFGVIHIDAVTYGEEVGTSKTKSENRVYAAKLGFNF
jgi:hypothetical protein